MGILSDDDILEKDYESYFKQKFMKEIQLDKIYYLMIRCHYNEVSAETVDINFRLELNLMEKDKQTDHVKDISKISSKFRKRVYRTDNVLRNTNFDILQKNLA